MSAPRSQGRLRGTSRRSRPTARGWAFLAAAAVLFFCAYWLSRPDVLVIAAFVAALPCGALIHVRYQRLRLDVRRTFSPPVAAAGHQVAVSLEVVNLSPRPLAPLRWRDEHGNIPADGAAGRTPALPGRGLVHRDSAAAASVAYELRPGRRGVFDVGPFVVSTIDPFRLAVATQVVGHVDVVTVVPDVADLGDHGLVIADAEGTARLVQQRSIGADHDTTTRAYRTGDALRRVHWRASAHHGELMVRQEEQRSHSEASVVLDTRVAGYAAPRARDTLTPGGEAFEWAVAFTASLAIHLQRSGFVVHLRETGSPQLAAIEQPTEFLTSMATMRLTADAEAPPRLVGEAGARPPGSVFAVVSDADAGTLEALAAAPRAFGQAVAFVVMPADDRVSSALETLGWTCVTVRPGVTAAEAWASVAAATPVTVEGQQ